MKFCTTCIFRHILASLSSFWKSVKKMAFDLKLLFRIIKKLTKILMKWWVIAILPLADNFFVLIILAANSSPEYICDEYSFSVQKVRTSTVQYTNSDFAFQRHFLGNISLFLLLILCLQISYFIIVSYSYWPVCLWTHRFTTENAPLK